MILNTLIFAYGFQLLGDGKNILRICNVIALLFFVDYIDLSEWNSQENMGCCSFDFMCSFPDYDAV